MYHGKGLTECTRLSDHVPLTKAVDLGTNDVLKIVLTATEGGKGKRPNQAFLLLRDQDTGLEATFPFTVKESGKGKVDLVCYSVPFMFLEYGVGFLAMLGSCLTALQC